MEVTPPRHFDVARRSLARAVRAARRRAPRGLLRTSAAILKAQQEATLDGILVIDPQGRVLSCNRRFLEIWGIPEDVAATSDDNELLGYAAEAVADWSSFIELVNYLYDHPEEVRTNDEVALKDGRSLARTSVPVITGGKVAGRAWYFRDVSDARQNEAMQSALFRIAQLSRDTQDLGAFYKAVHEIIGTLMDATNFYIADYDASRDILTFPYFVDQMDDAPEGKPPGRGITAYVLRTGKSLLATPEVFAELNRAGEVEQIGAPSLDWLGAPLKTGERTWGVIGVQTYAEAKRYSERDREILVFVAQHVAAAVDQKRQERALRESELRYRQMFENNRAVQLLIDPENGTIVDANVAAADFYGYDRDTLRGMPIWKINILGEDSVRAEMENASKQKRGYFNFRHRLADGELREVEVHSGPVDAAGRRLLYSIIHDITERKRAEEGLLHSEEKYRNIFDFAPVGIYQSTIDGRVVTANLTLARMLGYDSVEELLGRNLGSDIYYHPEQREENIRRFAPRGYAADLELMWKRRDGTPIWIQLNAHALTAGDGTLMFEGFVTDITERNAANETARQQSAAMTAAMDGIGILNDRLELTYSNDALAKLFGFSEPATLLGRSLCDLYEPPEQVRIVTSVLPIVQQRGRWRGEATGLRRDGGTFPQEISITSIEGGGMVCVVRDITERTYAEEQIKHLAYHDALTGMPNRLLFRDRVTVALSHAQRDGTRLALLFLDLDRFKVINDSLGHNIGDQLLQAVAERIDACVRDSDTVARLGGDEFTLLLPNLARAEDAAVVAEKILETIRHPFQIDGRELFVSTSIGISVYPEDGLDAATLIKSADTAMYQAKEQGRDNYQLFNAFVSAKALQRIQLEHGLRRALTAGELSLHYQPIFDLRTNSISGMEALMRWQHPELGAIPPAVFIPLAESIGVAVPIGMWALQAACEQAKAWHDGGFRNLTLAVNLSVCQLQQPDFIGCVEAILEDTGLPARMLELEITESSAMQSPETSIKTLYDLKKLGVRISLDDFGTGHSSLSYLKSFPVDTLKVDQSFVRDIITDTDTAAIVTAIIAMAHSLRLKVVAEGVELTEQAAFLRRCGCDQMQGFLIQPPLSADNFLRVIRANEPDAPRLRVAE
jgi:diguanylate cyclase (GGDEF)-like protein/PAS domain S-box-containing protein